MCRWRARWRAGSYGHAVLPAVPHDSAPGAADGADRAGVVMPAGAGGRVEVLRPGLPWRLVSARVQNAERRRLLQPQRNARVLAFAGLDRDGGLAGVAGERVPRWGSARGSRRSRRAARGGDHAAAFEQREEHLPVGMRADRGGDLALELRDLRVQRRDHRDQAQHELAASLRALLADTAARVRCASLASSCGGFLAAGVVLSRRGMPLSAPRRARARRPGWGSAPGTPARSSRPGWRTSPSGPGQNRSSSARDWLHHAQSRCADRSSRPRVSARSALV